MATLEATPLSSTHFTHSQRIRGPGASVAAESPPMPPQPNANPSNPNPYYLPLMMPYGYPPYAPATGAPYYLPLPFTYPPYCPAYPPPPFPYGDPHSHPTACPQTPVAAPGSAPTSPLKITLPYLISLTDFCEKYEINEEDKGQLEKLKFQPGDRCAEKLEPR